MTFANLADAGDRLAPLTSGLPADALLLGIVPNGVPVAGRIAQHSGMDLEPVVVARSDDGVQVTHMPDVTGRTVVIVDDGIETGTTARAVIAAAQANGAASVVVAMPVIPREVEAWLALACDRVIAVDRPLARRSLAWHYEEFDV